MKKYQSIKQIDLTEKSRHSQLNPHDRKQSSKFNSCTRSAKRSLSKQQFDHPQCLTDRMNQKVNEFQPSPNTNLPSKTNIKTYIRFKPITNNELLHENDFAVIEQLDIPNSTTVTYDENTHFNYDRVFEPESHQKVVYDQCAKELVTSFIDGYNATIFAYGQTGSGKTFTMFGEIQKKGIIPQSIDDIFEGIQRMKGFAQLSCSMLEIYRENMIDLLTQEQKDLKIKQTNTGIQVSSLSMHPIHEREDIMKLINKGTELRKIRGTDVNQRSSRSHLIFTLYLEVKKNEFEIRRSKLNMVDLAGSQKVSKTKVSGEGLQEAKKINLSLSCLGNTINALSKGQDHIPFRDSKLTRVLQESLSGNSLTRVIVTCSMHSSCQQQTYSSLKFAHRVKKIKTGPVQNIYQHRSSEQSVNRMMYQTLKTSFKNYEEKINQIKELVSSQASSSSTKEQIIEMISMIIQGEEITLTEGAIDTDRSRRYQEFLDRKLRTSKRKKESSISESSEQLLKQLECKVRDLEKIVIKQEEIIKNQSKEIQKFEKTRVKIRDNNVLKEKKNLQNKLKIHKLTSNKKQTEGEEGSKITELIDFLKSFKNQKASYEKMEKQILCRQVEDLMNRICAKEEQKYDFQAWKNNLLTQKQSYFKLEASLQNAIQMLQNTQFKEKQVGSKICNDLSNMLRSPSQKGYSLSRVNSTQKF